MHQMRIVVDPEGEVALDDLARKVRTVLDESGGGGGISFPQSAPPYSTAR